MSKFLLDEPSLQVQPSLVISIGLNEAIALQQLHWVLQNPAMGKIVDGKKYVHMSYKEWRKGHFPFWSEATIQRTFDVLIKKKLVESRGDLNTLSFDRTHWYTINHAEVAKVEESLKTNERVIEHIKMIDGHCKMKDASKQNETTIPDTSVPESSAPENSESSGQKPPAPPEPPKAEKPAKPKADLFPVATSLSEVCQMPFEINRGRLFREAKQLCAAAVVPPVTPDEIRARYGAGGWWYREDWRGQKGEPPTPAAIRGTWGQWTVPKVIPFKQDTKAAKLADTFARWDSEAGNGNTTNHNGDPQEIFECVSFTVT